MLQPSEHPTALLCTRSNILPRWEPQAWTQTAQLAVQALTIAGTHHTRTRRSLPQTSPRSRTLSSAFRQNSAAVTQLGSLRHGCRSLPRGHTCCCRTASAQTPRKAPSDEFANRQTNPPRFGPKPQLLRFHGRPLRDRPSQPPLPAGTRRCAGRPPSPHLPAVSAPVTAVSCPSCAPRSMAARRERAPGLNHGRRRPHQCSVKWNQLSREAKYVKLKCSMMK